MTLLTDAELQGIRETADETDRADVAWLCRCLVDAYERIAELTVAASLARHELRFMLNSYPERRGGKYEAALNALNAVLAEETP